MPAIGVHHTATVDEPWDGPAAVAAMPNSEATLHYCHAWETSGAGDEKGDYKFPHHRTKGGPANLPACHNGLSRLESADVPDGDRAGIRSHLQAHIDDGDKKTDDQVGHVLTFDRIGTLTNAERIRCRMPRAHRISDSDEWYRITDAVDGQPARLDLFDEIGFWGTTAADFNAQLQATTGDTLTVHINSGGGDAFDGIAIMNLLRAHPAAVDVVVDGLAASAASYIAMGGDTLTMMPNSEMMIHDASGICIGNPADMEAMRDLLNHVSDNIASVYAARAGGTVPDWRAAMGKESWYTAQEAVDAGLADKLGATRSKPPAENRWNMSFYAYNCRADAPAPVIPVRSAADRRPPVTVPTAPVYVFDPAEFRAAMRINPKEAAQ